MVAIALSVAIVLVGLTVVLVAESRVFAKSSTSGRRAVDGILRDIGIGLLVGGVFALSTFWAEDLREGREEERETRLEEREVRRDNIRFLRETIVNQSQKLFANLDLREAPLGGLDLSAAVFTDADLSDADLRRANLSGADLTGANLSGANLTCADLSGAKLQHANLSRVNTGDIGQREAGDLVVTEAIVVGEVGGDGELSGAGGCTSFDGVYLYLNELTGSRLATADLSEARLENVCWQPLDPPSWPGGYEPLDSADWCWPENPDNEDR